MFNAFSKTKNCIVSVDDEYNLNEIFYCPTPDCAAEFKIRSVNGKNRKHFARIRGIYHDVNCPFGLLVDDSYNCAENCIKMDLDEILYKSIGSSTDDNKTRNQHDTDINIDKKKSEVQYIRTLNQLISYCLNNDIKTEYKNGLTISDILVDSRTLACNKNYEGFNGIRLLIGQTIKFDASKSQFVISVKTKTLRGLTLSLTANVYFPNDIFQNNIKYILESNNNQFKFFPVAILGNWENDKRYVVSCTVNKKKNFKPLKKLSQRKKK